MIYFDYASSTPICEEVLSSYSNVLITYFANPSAIHKMGLETSILLEKAREQIANILHIKSSEVFFTSGATESNNLAIKGICFKYKNRGNHIITSSVEHPSVLNVFKQLKEQFGFDVTYIKPNKNGIISLEDFKKVLRKDTILTSIMFVNNETGAINEIEKISKYIKDNNYLCFFHTDATQGFGKIDLDLTNIDLLSMSAHKIYGLKGSGLLLKKENVDLYHLIEGGGQEGGIRSGTSNFPIDLMLAKTIRLAFEQKQKDYNHVSNIKNRIEKSIENLDTIFNNSPLNSSPYILNISIKNIKSAILLKYFEDNQIIVSATSACGAKKNQFSYVINETFNDIERASSAIRLSFSRFNTLDDAEQFLKVLKNINIK